MSDKVKLKIVYNKVLSDESFTDSVITIDKSKFDSITDKSKFVGLLNDLELPFPLSKDSNYLKFTRKSKKNKGYINLESIDDFKCLSRSLNVKNHVKLTINDHSPVEKVPESKTFTTNSEPKSTVSDSDDPPTVTPEYNQYSKDDDINLGKLAELFTDVAKEKLKEVIGEFATEILHSFTPKEPKESKESAKEPEAKKYQAVHSNSCCDSCNPDTFVPIKGIRYKCLTCFDYDLCQDCETNFLENEIITGTHSYLHATMKIITPESFRIDKAALTHVPSVSNIHHAIYCDCCDKGPIRGTRYKCKTCPNYDLCEDCYDNQIFQGSHYGFHSPDHEMNVFKKPAFSCPSYESATSSNNQDIKFSTNGTEDILDINLDSSAKPISNKIKALLSEFGIVGFLDKLTKVFEDSERYNNLLELLKSEVDDDDVRYAILQSIVYENQDFKNTVTKTEDIEIKDYIDPIDSDLQSTELLPGQVDFETIPKTNNSNEFILKTKRFGPNSKIFSVSLTNNSTHYFPAGDMVFEFFDSESNDSIVVRNASSIDSCKQRFYNLKGDIEKFIGKKVQISFNNDDFKLVGDFGSESSLTLVKSTTGEAIQVNEKVESVKTSESLSIDVVLKAKEMVQLVIYNNNDETFDCSDLSIKINNFLGNTIGKVLVHKRHGIKPWSTSKFNISLNSAHLKIPFKIILNNGKYEAIADLSLNRLSTEFEVKQLENDVPTEIIESEDSGEEDIKLSGNESTESFTEVERTPEVEKTPEVERTSEIQETETETEGNSPATETEGFETEEEKIDDKDEKSVSLGSTDSMVLPSLPKESTIKDDVEMLIDLGNSEIVSDNEFELGSDYEILTPSTSNYH
ncbi:hypothetical protein CLIB1444_06S03202 [[Candida] jaroonii]|uniref:Uncharacterized protein n=1 Tax=[Candida] jaroonii TaxID=467808 RepID=A0ACA9Y9I0_9ASCO|nr:hypothetical protein CLIB1444_06S03202 [[Candida] jaroonii]